MTNETIPELPDWVKVLIADARSEGYESGLKDGAMGAWSIMRRETERHLRSVEIGELYV